MCSWPRAHESSSGDPPRIFPWSLAQEDERKLAAMNATMIRRALIQPSPMWRPSDNASTRGLDGLRAGASGGSRFESSRARRACLLDLGPALFRADLVLPAEGKQASVNVTKRFDAISRGRVRRKEPTTRRTFGLGKPSQRGHHRLRGIPGPLEDIDAMTVCGVLLVAAVGLGGSPPRSASTRCCRE